jgi:hypothetical protein
MADNVIPCICITSSVDVNYCCGVRASVTDLPSTDLPMATMMDCHPMCIVVHSCWLALLAPKNDPTGYYYGPMIEYVVGMTGPEAANFWGKYLLTMPIEEGKLIVS